MKLRFIDCGANVGQSIEWALKTFAHHDLKIDSFEPLPKNFEILAQKFEGNARVNLHNVAVSVHDGTQIFYCQNWGARTGSSLVKGKLSTSTDDAVEVQTIDLASWIKKNVLKDEIVVLKIDVEGEEYRLLPHLLENDIQKISDFWFIEFHGSKIKNCDLTVENLVKEKVKYVFDWSRPNEVLLRIQELNLLECTSST
jgi:FkbM family methyltransferase